MKSNILNEVIRISLIFLNIVLLLCWYNNYQKCMVITLLNMSILLLIKGVVMYINRLDNEFLCVLIIKISLVSLLVTEFYILK